VSNCKEDQGFYNRLAYVNQMIGRKSGALSILTAFLDQTILHRDDAWRTSPVRALVLGA